MFVLNIGDVNLSTLLKSDLSSNPQGLGTLGGSPKVDVGQHLVTEMEIGFGLKKVVGN